jgi:hypothetical protein
MKYSEVRRNAGGAYFRTKLDEIYIPPKDCFNNTTTSSNALLAYYKLSYREAQNQNPHKMADAPIPPAARDMVQTLCDERCT